MPDAATEYVTLPPAVVPAWLVIPGAGVEVQGWTCRHCRVFVAGGAEEIEHGEYCPAREGGEAG